MDLTCTVLVHRKKRVFQWEQNESVRMSTFATRSALRKWPGGGGRWCITFLPGANLPWRASVDDSTASEGRRISSVGVVAWVLASDVSHLLRFFAPEAQIVCDSRIRIFPYSLRGHPLSLRDTLHAMLFFSYSSVTENKISNSFNYWN